MLRIFLALTLALAGCSAAVPTADATPMASAVIGQAAPGFTLADVDGRPVSLSDYAGKTVVLEWFNPGCPFVKYAHGEGVVRDVAGRWTGKGVVWLAINSGAPGKQGAGADTNRQAKADWSIPYPVLLDETGAVGKMYGAKTTPQVVVIDPQGRMVYNGALDNAPMGKPDGTAVNYVDAALQAVTAGQPVAAATTKPYGCGVKYAD